MSQAIQRGIIILAVLLVAAVGISVFALVQKKGLEEQNQSLQDQLADTKTKQEKILAESQNLKQQIQKLQQDNSEFTQKLADKDKEKEKLQSDKDKLQNDYDDLKRKGDDLSSQAEQANKERDDWKSKITTIRKERDELMNKLQHQPVKIVYKDKPVEPAAEGDSSGGTATPVTPPSTGKPEADEYWAKVLTQKAQLEVDLSKAKADLDKSAIQVADLRKQNTDMQMQIKDLGNDRTEVERRLSNDRKRLEDNYARERQTLQRKIKDSEDLISNLSMEAARARTDQKSANDFGGKLKDDNVQLQSEVKQLVATKVALEKTVARLNQEKDEMGKRLADTEGVIQDRINEIWQIKQTLDQKISQINQAKSDKEVELPPIIVSGSGASGVASSAASSSMTATAPEVQTGTHKIISINAKNNFAIIDYGQIQGSSIGRILKAYRGNNEIATLEVIQVRRDISAADIKDQKVNLQVGDQVR
jgi:chromosome segregation ATPase